MEKANKLMEKFWLIVAIITFIYAIYMILTQTGLRAGLQYLLMPGIAFFWWLFRRGMRRRLERNAAQNKDSR